jgi:glutaredoxin 3
MFCNRAKEFLSLHGIAFEERDVSSDETALEELQKRNLMTTPVTLIDGDAVVGFDRAKLSTLLGITQ